MIWLFQHNRYNRKETITFMNKNHVSKKLQFCLCSSTFLLIFITSFLVISHNNPPTLSPESMEIQAKNKEAIVSTKEQEKSTSATPEPFIKKVPAVKESDVTLSMVGDILLHGPASESGRRANNTYNYDHFFKDIRKIIRGSDCALVNEEVVLAGEAFRISGYPRFNGRFEVGDAIAKAGFNVVLHATNHSLDTGVAGLKACLKRWRTAHPAIQVTGMYDRKKDANTITYVKKNGIKIAILNYTYGTNGIPMPAELPFAVNLMSKSKVKKDVIKAKKHSDFVVVCPHWGTEYRTTPDAYQEQWSQYLLELGVDLVIGTHPHVIEPVKMLTDTNGHKMLVYYSLGNYINSSSSHKVGVYRQYCGGLANVTIHRNSTGKVSIKKAKFIPLITQWQGNQVITYQVKHYTRKMAESNRLKLQDSSYSYDNVINFFRQTISKKYLAL